MSARLVRAARRVVEAMGELQQQDAIAELAAALPRKRGSRTARKVEREAKRLAKRDSDAKVRERVLARDGACRICGCVTDLEVDHFWGRGRDRTDSGCWVLCRRHHEAKTNNRPSRANWLSEFRIHVAPISAEQACRVDAALAKYRGQHPRASRPERETA